MKVGDLVKHGWIADKCGVIVDFYDKQHSCSGDSEERIRLYDVIWTDKTPPYISREASFAIEVIDESR